MMLKLTESYKTAVISTAHVTAADSERLPTLPSIHVNEEKSAPAIIQYTEKNTPQNDENNPEKNHLKNNETTYAGRKNKPPISPKGILAV